MIDFAESTGGRFFKNNNDLLHGLNDLAAPETSYVLAFSPHPLKHDGKFHKLKINVKASGHIAVYARRGYFAPTEKEAEAERVKVPSSAPLPVPTIEASAPAETKPPAVASENVAPPEEAKPSIPTQPPSERGAAAKADPTPPEAGPAAGTDSSISSVATKPSSADADAVAAELAFLQQGSREVEHYIEAFADLTADETRVMQSFDNGGLRAKERSMQSALVVYRLRTDPKDVVEYRDVVSVDGHEIKDHAAQATKLWHELAGANSAEEEIRRIAKYSERYDIGVAETGFTLFEGLPLRALCMGDFAFREVRHEVTSLRLLRVFSYRQIHPCNVISYHFVLPRQFTDVPLTQAGEIALDAKTGQIVREDRSVYAGHLERKPPRVAHFVLSYGDSSFGILVPKTILIEIFYPLQNFITPAASFQLRARMVQTYGPFSRFEVRTVEKASAPAR